MLNFRCGGCGTINVVPSPPWRTKPRCVECAREPDVSGKSQRVRAGDLRTALHSSMVPVLVELWEPWSVPAATQSSIVDAVARERAGRLIALWVDTAAEPALARALHYAQVPELVLFLGGEEVARLAGAAHRTEVERWIDGSMHEAPADEARARRGA